MSFVIGLTGSIGMGKSSTAKIFADEGCPVWDADAAVHRLYGKGGAAVAPMQSDFPDAIVDGAVSRDKLKEIIGADPTALKKIEGIVHPLVGIDRADFIAANADRIVVLDTPLLFETGANKTVDVVVVVTIDEEEQKRRVLERGTMTEEQFLTIKAKQTPDVDKRTGADYIVLTTTPEHAKQQVRQILEDIRGKMNA